jgi:hypothetical protein
MGNLAKQIARSAKTVTVFTAQDGCFEAYQQPFDLIINASALARSCNPTFALQNASRLLGICLAKDALAHALRLRDFGEIAVIHPNATETQKSEYSAAGFIVK